MPLIHDLLILLSSMRRKLEWGNCCCLIIDNGRIYLTWVLPSPMEITVELVSAAVAKLAALARRLYTPGIEVHAGWKYILAFLRCLLLLREVTALQWLQTALLSPLFLRRSHALDGFLRSVFPPGSNNMCVADVPRHNKTRRDSN